ncbi:hypothetical protein CLV46_0183 [Diaminobutyricimonas aerilata]|uniref:DUF7882 domain-containing protein n=1 Tax=Diaminobutyricimonas aerilata TaxID=1162967 RepID=A0A2M9CFF6_9MICO|nr:hypothetical protein [Diaminobutyricimonas aerilata]PJJ70661.1 hypothetical protein CLV46_0183 [Diaminobutyricimonas aerilata]
MGTLYYGAQREPIPLDDEVLTCLQLVATSKLRRAESFVISWVRSDEAGARRCILWMHAGLDLEFEFDGVDPVPVHRRMLDAFTNAAHSNRGIQLDAAHAKDSFAGV